MQEEGTTCTCGSGHNSGKQRSCGGWHSQPTGPTPVRQHGPGIWSHSFLPPRLSAPLPLLPPAPTCAFVASRPRRPSADTSSSTPSGPRPHRHRPPAPALRPAPVVSCRCRPITRVMVHLPDFLPPTTNTRTLLPPTCASTASRPSRVLPLPPGPMTSSEAPRPRGVRMSRPWGRGAGGRLAGGGTAELEPLGAARA